MIELIKLEYADSNNLYMPVTSLSLIQRYIGSSGLGVKLSMLGSDRWLKIKNKEQKRKLKILLLNYYLFKQKEISIMVLSLNLMIMNSEKFCNQFPYVETDDQLQCMK